MNTIDTSHSVIFILFGATGDLAQKKIMPALLNLYKRGVLSDTSKVIAFSRRPWSDADYRNFIRPYLEEKKFSPEEIATFLEHVVYTQGTFDNAEAFHSLKKKVDELELHMSMASQKIFHLAVQPEFYLPITQGLSVSGLTAAESGIMVQPKILIEKPFGNDLESAESLEKSLEAFLTHHQIYRIDHYLGKMGLWNMLLERIQNQELEKKLTNEFVSSVSIKFHEKIGIEGRGEFYNAVGVVRDVVQNHMLEMLAFTLMDLPNDSSDESFMKARAHALQSLHMLSPEEVRTNVLRAQYEGYLDEADVPQDSQTETYIKIIASSDNEHWKNVPIILEAGKALPEKKSTIEITFKDGTQKIFDVDIPKIPDAYEQVIAAAQQDNKKCFVSIDEVLASWKFVEPILKNINSLPLKKYTIGNLPK